MKRISFIAAAAAAFCLGGIAGPPLGGSEARAAELVSVNDSGTDSGNGFSTTPFLSADGTKVVFVSAASDLGPTDTNGTRDVFVRDLTTGTTTLVSVNGAGTDSGNGFSSLPVISADGTKVAFDSRASNLGSTDTNGTSDIYVRDLTMGTTTLVSVNDLGTDSGNGFSTRPVISADGTKVAFISFASNLGSTDTNGTFDVYVRDLTMGTTTLVSVNDSGTDSGNGFSTLPFLSADGTKVAFRGLATDLVPTADTNGNLDVFVRDLTTGTTTLVSINDLGTDSGNGPSFFGVISADGTKVAFRSSASNLGPIDTNGFLDIYVRDVTPGGTTTLVSVNDSGTDSGNGSSDLTPAFSADGTKVAFRSFASDLGPTDTNGTSDVFVRGPSAGTTTLVSVNDSGTDSGNGSSDDPAISANGTTVAFESFASNLVVTDSNNNRDVFVALITGPVELIANLIDDVVDLNLQKGISNSFDAKLDAVVQALSDANTDNDVAAINALEAFILGVEAQRGKELTDAEADALILAAQAIIDLLVT